MANDSEDNATAVPPGWVKISEGLSRPHLFPADMYAKAKKSKYPTAFPPEGWVEKKLPPGPGFSEEFKKEHKKLCNRIIEELLQKWDEEDSPEGIAKMRRNERRFYACAFRRQYEYLSENTKERKTCIWSSDGVHGVHESWDEKYSGVTWVGVHGTDSICVVTLADELDMTRVAGSAGDWRKVNIMCEFRRAAIYEVEVLPNPPGKTFKKTFEDWMKSIKKPFGVVCVSGDSDKGYGEQKAIEFLKEEFTKNAGLSTPTFGTDKTVMTAISALQHLCNKEFKKANEIEVSLMDPNYWISAYEYFKDLTIEELPIKKIKKYLVAINEPEFKGKEPNMEDLDMWLIKKEMNDAKKPRFD